MSWSHCQLLRTMEDEENIFDPLRAKQPARLRTQSAGKYRGELAPRSLPLTDPFSERELSFQDTIHSFP